MMDFKLHVLSGLSQDAFSPALSAHDFPQGVTGTLAAWKGGELSLPTDSATLVLTDSAQTARELCREKPDRLHVVFLGPAAEVSGLENALEDIWSPQEAPAARKARFDRLVKVLQDRFDLWFYKNTLVTTIDTVPDMLWYKRLDGIHMMVNDAFTGIVHKTKEDVTGKDHFYIWDAPRPAEGSGEFACAESEEIAISTGKTYICDEPVKTREGMKQFTTYKTPVYDMFGNVFGTVGVGHDVTNFSNLGIELSILVENLPFPMTIFTPDWKVVQMNRSFSALVGAGESKEAAGFDYRSWKSANLSPVSERVEDSTHHRASREYRFQLNGETKYAVVTELEIRDFFDNVSGYFATIQDITYRRAYEQSILKAANTDSLTGMYNRRYFYNFLSSNVGKPFHLLYMDMDHFKEINDNFGHHAGDEVLVKTSQLIQEFFPHSVTARLGGDEFVVLDEDHDRGWVETRCQELEAAVAEAFRSYGKGVGISIGISHTDGSELDIDRIIHTGDALMYEAKKRHHDDH